MKVLFVHPYPSQKAPSQRFRHEQFLKLLKFEIDQKSFWVENEWPRIYQHGSIMYKVLCTLRGFGRRIGLLFQIGKYDKVFIHREATPIGPPWFEWAVSKLWKKPIIFDFDDAIWLPNSSNANEKTAGRLKFHGKTARICSWATTVVAGNDFLADYAKQHCEDVRIIPTTIDSEHHHNPDLYVKRGSKWLKKTETLTTDTDLPLTSPLNTQYSIPNTIPTIGWTGTHSTLKQLTPLFPVLEEVYQTHPFRFLLIADVPPISMPDFVEFRKWRIETEIEDLLEIDIGVMPLYDTKWERGKCGFKALQYMALEKACVVSGVGVNLEIIGNNQYGLCAESMSEKASDLWRKHLTYLLDKPESRLALGSAGRLRIEKSYSVRAHQKCFQEILTK